jgi:haloalkane dehalogenase
MNVFRTPDEPFENLPGYPYVPHYVEVDGLRPHHLDEGSGPTVLCFDGEQVTVELPPAGVQHRRQQ